MLGAGCGIVVSATVDGKLRRGVKYRCCERWASSEPNKCIWVIPGWCETAKFVTGQAKLDVE